MKLLAILIMLVALYLLYRIAFPRQAETKKSGQAPSLPPPPGGYEAVVKSRFVLPSRSNSAQQDDRTQESDKQYKKPDIFAAGNEKPDAAVIPPAELDEVFGEDVNPDDLEIVRDENETGGDGGPDQDGDEEDEETRVPAGETESYAGGFTYDELAAAIRETDRQPGAVAKAAVETLRDLSQTDMFEQLVSGDAGRSSRISAILDQSEQSLAVQSGNAADDDSDSAYRDFDMTEYLS